MLKVTELAFCCYAVTDMKRARAFYEQTFNLRPSVVLDGEHGQWTEYQFGPDALALGCSPDWKPSSDGCVAALEVEDFNAAVSQLRAQNVKFRVEPMETPVCHMAMVYDPDGNTVCVHRRKAR